MILYLYSLSQPIRSNILAANILQSISRAISSLSPPPFAQRRASGVSGGQGRMISRFCSGCISSCMCVTPGNRLRQDILKRMRAGQMVSAVPRVGPYDLFFPVKHCLAEYLVQLILCRHFQHHPSF